MSVLAEKLVLWFQLNLLAAPERSRGAESGGRGQEICRLRRAGGRRPVRRCRGAREPHRRGTRPQQRPTSRKFRGDRSEFKLEETRFPTGEVASACHRT